MAYSRKVAEGSLMKGPFTKVWTGLPKTKSGGEVTRTNQKTIITHKPKG